MFAELRAVGRGRLSHPLRGVEHMVDRAAEALSLEDVRTLRATFDPRLSTLAMGVLSASTAGEVRHTRFDELDRLCTAHHRQKTHDGKRLESGTGTRRVLSPEEQRELGLPPPSMRSVPCASPANGSDRTDGSAGVGKGPPKTLGADAPKARPRRRGEAPTGGRTARAPPPTTRGTTATRGAAVAGRCVAGRCVAGRCVAGQCMAGQWLRVVEPPSTGMSMPVM
jgi:hypothetical protein